MADGSKCEGGSRLSTGNYVSGAHCQKFVSIIQIQGEPKIGSRVSNQLLYLYIYKV